MESGESYWKSQPQGQTMPPGIPVSKMPTAIGIDPGGSVLTSTA